MCGRQQTPSRTPGTSNQHLICMHPLQSRHKRGKESLLLHLSPPLSPTERSFQATRLCSGVGDEHREHHPGGGESENRGCETGKRVVGEGSRQ
jgi:hypothetical protein